MNIVLVLALIAVLLAAIELVRYRGESLTSWAAVLLGIAVVWYVR